VLSWELKIENRGIKSKRDLWREIDPTLRIKASQNRVGGSRQVPVYRKTTIREGPHLGETNRFGAAPSTRRSISDKSDLVKLSRRKEGIESEKNLRKRGRNPETDSSKRGPGREDAGV